MDQKQQIAEKQKELLKAWEDAIENVHKQIGNGRTKKEFTFTTNESKQLLKLDAIKALATQTIEDKINTDVLERVGIKTDPSMDIQFDLRVGRFVIWIPKTEPSKKEPTSNSESNT